MLLQLGMQSRIIIISVAQLRINCCTSCRSGHFKTPREANDQFPYADDLYSDTAEGIDIRIDQNRTCALISCLRHDWDLIRSR
jgi:hypothetical protein